MEKELIVFNEDMVMISARELHKELEIKYDFTRWVKSNFKEFIENVDYFATHIDVSSNQNGGIKTVTDYNVMIDMAKHLCLLSKTEKGRVCRQRLIDLEKAWNSPEQVMARALKIADKKIDILQEQNKFLLEKKEQAEKVIEEQKPLVDFADRVSNTDEAITIGKFAKFVSDKGIKTGRNRLFQYLRDKDILMEDNIPYQQYIDGGYFKVKEVWKRNAYGKFLNYVTLITGKGQLWLNKKLVKDFC